MIGIDSTKTPSLNYVRIIALAEIAEGMFITRLLELEPQWQLLLDERAKVCQPLAQALRQAVADITRLNGFPEALNELGAAPEASDPHRRDYQRLGVVFITQLERASAVPMTEQTRTRWEAVFRLLTEMQQTAAATA